MKNKNDKAKYLAQLKCSVLNVFDYGLHVVFLKRIYGRKNIWNRFLHIPQYQQPDILSCECKFFCVYRPYKESIRNE